MVDEADTIIAKLATLSNKSALTRDGVSGRVRIPSGRRPGIVTSTQTGCYVTADVSRVLADRPGMVARPDGAHPDCISSGLVPELISELIAAPESERR